MADVHVYVRLQASVSNADAVAIQQAVESLQSAVLSAGAAWRGDVHVTLDEPAEAPAEPELTPRPEPEPAQEFPAE